MNRLFTQLFNLFRQRKDLDKSKSKCYEESVNSVMSTVSNLINPFEAQQEQLVSLASGFVVANDVADAILNAEQLGEEQFAQFVNHNLLGPEPDIFAKFKLNRLSTFSTTKKGEGNQYENEYRIVCTIVADR